MPTSRRRPTRTLRILLWRHRVLLTVGVVALVALGAARQLAPPPQPTVEVVVTAGAVGTGEVLTVRDVRTTVLPRAAVPDGTITERADAVGQRVRTDLPAGMPLVETLLVGDRFDITAPDGTVMVAVRIDSGTSGLIRPGDRVDLVGGPAGSALTAHAHDDVAVLARRALVLEVVQTDGGEVLGLGASGAGAVGTAVVAVTPAEGRTLAGAASRSPLGAVLVG
ncbi:Flp pilus assembly protein CpaB [Cellulomonas bogoriensis]|uniref:SAF domain-containing protein n=1 Tax=Cellulomonas bogoriensis 69B4 = DSM 16987 TaxID=1386082 RepID=A0A0A0BS21_9CELL|nr:RcpC/CpaB family pilus assembly protein [Cellulomonas bogoriensis]KGM10731.1 hypothetical protein N869_02375 [Cellulomonas bogoriensis 69B4 = DSM 16987]